MTVPTSIKKFDDRRDIVVGNNKEASLNFAVEHFIKIANDAISKRGVFVVALSGGSTPKAIFLKLTNEANSKRVQWEKVRLFWSDERSVGPDNPDSNYKMAMDAGFSTLPIKRDNIFRMKAEKDIEIHAILYEDAIERKAKVFDLIMLGMGDDGHTASLFPYTQGLEIEDRLVVANFVPQKDTWRMSFTYTGIHNTRNLAVYVLGLSKKDMVKTVLSSPLNYKKYPVQNVGTKDCKALWVLDADAFSGLNQK
jgi:6-phosphogluconolactonase